jgi:hypothetical protein
MTMTANFSGPSEGGTHPSGDTPAWVQIFSTTVEGVLTTNGWMR